MKYKQFDRYQDDEVDLGDERYNEKRNRNNKRGKRHRDSFEGRDRDWDWN